MTSVVKTICAEDHLAKLLMATAAGIRAELLLSAVSFRPAEHLDVELTVGPLRAAFADSWEQRFGQAVPIVALRDALEPPVAIGTLLPFLAVKHVDTIAEVQVATAKVLVDLQRIVRSRHGSQQLPLFDSESTDVVIEEPCTVGGGKVSALNELIAAGKRYPTVYADPPWQYSNRASRAAAENHYRTLSVEQICDEPVGDLTTENAHLHLWTTNAFLRDAFTVIDAWGFTFKSCLVWVKDDLGMGNYWRVSHEFLLLGVRGQLTFRDRTTKSWLQAPRTVHSRKPPAIRSLVEKVSPGPYLEMYGREELPGSAWTVYGNQVEPRLF